MGRDIGTQRLTYGRFGRLLRQLPREAAYVQAVAGAVAAWSTTDHLLASVVNELRIAAYQFGRIHFKPPHTKPTFIESPGTAKPDKPKMTIVELRERLAGPWRAVIDEPREEVTADG